MAKLRAVTVSVQGHRQKTSCSIGSLLHLGCEAETLNLPLAHLNFHNDTLEVTRLSKVPEGGCHAWPGDGWGRTGRELQKLEVEWLRDIWHHMTLHGKSCEPVNSLQSMQHHQQKPWIHEYFLELFSNSNWTCFSCLRFASSLNLALQVFKGTPGKLMERVWGPGFWSNELILDWWEEALQDGFQTSKIIQAKSCVFSKSQLKVSLHPTDWQESDCSCPICGLWWWGPNVKNRRFWGWFHDSAIECFYLPGLCSHFRGTWFGEGHGVVTLWRYERWGRCVVSVPSTPRMWRLFMLQSKRERSSYARILSWTRPINHSLILITHYNSLWKKIQWYVYSWRRYVNILYNILYDTLMWTWRYVPALLGMALCFVR